MSKARKKASIAEFVMYGNVVSTRPRVRYEAVFSPSLLRRLLGWPYGREDFVGIRQVHDE